MEFRDPPALDAHAHIATDVTAAQVRGLGGAVVFAMTRSLSEAASVPHGCYSNILWGIGVHPRDADGLDRYSGERFETLLPKFALVGEVGLDRRAGRFDRQQEVFAEILLRTGASPVIVSIHSTAVAADVIAHLKKHPVRAPILHWFGGTTDQISEAAEFGAWFSVNAAMKDEVITAMPRGRLLTETDFPYTRRAGATRPGSTGSIISKLATLSGADLVEVRQELWQNFRTLVDTAYVRSRLPMQMQMQLAASIE
jgi:TatD DNase family protein